MTRVGKLLQLSAEDRRLLVTAALLQAGIRLGLAVLPYRRVRLLVDRMARMSPPRTTAGRASVERITWAVMRASSSVPGATCLTQALAAGLLMERHGHAALIRVGFTRDGRAGLLAHAWVESGGRIVLGGANASRYTPLAVPEGEARVADGGRR